MIRALTVALLLLVRGPGSASFRPGAVVPRFGLGHSPRHRRCPPPLAPLRSGPSDADAGRSAARAEFLRIIPCAAAVLLPPIGRGGEYTASAFEGGVGGLGKTKPETGVVFRDPDSVAGSGGGGGGGGGGTVTNELLAPDGTPVLVTFAAPWPLLRSSGSVESRDLANPEAAFVQVARAPEGATGAADLPKSFFADTVFGQRGKFGAYGAPSDIKIKRLDPPSSATAPGTVLYSASFTTLTPAMRESERRAYISASVVGDGAFLLVTGTTSPRFKKLEGQLRDVAESFACAAAPRSGLRGGN